MNSSFSTKNIFFMSLSLLASASIFGRTNFNNSTDIPGPDLEEYVSTYMGVLFSKHHNNKEIQETEKRIVDSFSEECPECTYKWVSGRFFKNNGFYKLFCQKSAINLKVKTEAVKYIEKITWDLAYEIAKSANDATDIAKLIGDEVRSILNSQSTYASGMLDDFTGNGLRNKVKRYHTNIVRSRQEKKERQSQAQAQQYRQTAQDYATLYFYPFSDKIDVNNLPAEFSRMKIADSRLEGNLNALVNNALDKLTMRNPTAADIRTALLDAAKDFIPKITYNYAKHKGCSDSDARSIQAKIEMQLENRIRNQHIKDHGINQTMQGQLKSYLGANLEKEIDAIRRDLHRN